MWSQRGVCKTIWYRQGDHGVLKSGDSRATRLVFARILDAKIAYTALSTATPSSKRVVCHLLISYPGRAICAIASKISAIITSPLNLSRIMPTVLHQPTAYEILRV